MLTRDMIACVHDFDKERVEIPEWGGFIYVRSMTVSGSDEMNRFYLRIPDVNKLQAKRGKSAKVEDVEITSESASAMVGMVTELVSRCICDENGILLFDDDEGRGILNTKSSVVLQRIYDAAMRVNKMGDEAMEQEKKELPEILSIGSNSNSA